MAIKTKTELKNWISESVSESLQLLEKLRTLKTRDPSLRFDMRVFRSFNNGRDIENYARQRLQKLGSGIDRVTFLLSSGKVLKIAYRNNVEQNKTEIAAYEKFGPEYMPIIYESHPDGFWIISELVKTFQSKEQFFKETGLTDDFLRKWAQFKWRNKKDKVNMDDFLSWFIEQYPELAYPNNITSAHHTITPRGEEFLAKLTHLLIMDVDDIQRWDHWGIGTDQRFVCVDVGFRV